MQALSSLARFTNGALLFYEGPFDGQRLYFDVSKELKKKVILEAVLRVRVSRGFRIASMDGHFAISPGSADLVTLPALDEHFTLLV